MRIFQRALCVSVAPRKDTLGFLISSLSTFSGLLHAFLMTREIVHQALNYHFYEMLFKTYSLKNRCFYLYELFPYCESRTL